MPKWEHVEDASPSPARVWMSRRKESEAWTPLRKVDCRALNECITEKKTTQLIEFGRATAHLSETDTIRYNYFNGPTKMLTSAIWFVVEINNNNNKEKRVVTPINKNDADNIEALYQEAVEATSSFGSGIDPILKREVELEHEADKGVYRVSVVKNGQQLSMKKKPTSWFGTTFDLQRGYGCYNFEGEQIEASLGPVTHLIFAIHGVGEALWSKEDVSIDSWVTEMNKLRGNLQRLQYEEFQLEIDKAKKMNKPEPKPPSRIEIVPIEWFDRIHSSSSMLMKSLAAATIPSVPALRAIAKNVVFDVMMYLTPGFCEEVLDCVTVQINGFYLDFLKIHPDFLACGGKCSIIGHSLGSVIAWDLLSILKESKFQQRKQGMQKQSSSKRRTESIIDNNNTDEESIIASLKGVSGVSIAGTNNVGVAYQSDAENNNDDDKANDCEFKVAGGTWGPSIRHPIKDTLPFLPEFTLLVGSPLGMFLTLRGAHSVYDAMRITERKRLKKQHYQMMKNADEKKEAFGKGVKLPFASPFTLPSGSVYNIFHPSDPIAYRIEPLLLSQEGTEKIPDPAYLNVEGKDLRLHVKAKELTKDISRHWSNAMSITDQIPTIWGQAVEAVENSSNDNNKSDIAKTLGSIFTSCNANSKMLGNGTTEKGINEDGLQQTIEIGPMAFRLGGKSDRVDFQLQGAVTDNEYLAAVSAHSTYFSGVDMQSFIMHLAAKDDANVTSEWKEIRANLADSNIIMEAESKDYCLL